MKCFVALLSVCFVATSGQAQSKSSQIQSQGTASPTAVSPTATAALEFEAATIKPVKEPAPYRMHDSEEGRRFSTRYTSLRDLLQMAYGLDRQQVAGGPAWVATDEYDVDAVADGTVSLDGNEKQWKAMLQKLLADRFKLTTHRERREMTVYTLIVAKDGPKLKAAEPNGQPNKSCRSLGNCTFTKTPLVGFARFMGFVVLDKPVQDKTGIVGEFDFTLKWTPDDSQYAAMGVRVPQSIDNPNAPPGLFTAIQEQIGLKLEPQKIPNEVLVIDHVERPSEN